jgi:hypothetical protein
MAETGRMNARRRKNSNRGLLIGYPQSSFDLGIFAPRALLSIHPYLGRGAAVKAFLKVRGIDYKDRDGSSGSRGDSYLDGSGPVLTRIWLDRSNRSEVVSAKARVF